MAKYSMKDRKDMSMGTRDYDKGYAKGRDMGVMKHDGKVERIETCEAEKFDLGRMQWRPAERRGYDYQAFDYKY